MKKLLAMKHQFHNGCFANVIYIGGDTKKKIGNTYDYRQKRIGYEPLIIYLHRRNHCSYFTLKQHTPFI